MRLWRQSPHIRSPNFVITVPADVLAPNSIRHSATTGMTRNWDIFTMWIQLTVQLNTFSVLRHEIQNGQRDLTRLQEKLDEAKWPPFCRWYFQMHFFSIKIFEFKISPKFVLKEPVNNIPTSVQIVAWRPPKDKPWSEPIIVSLLRHICVTRPQWVDIYSPRIEFTTTTICCIGSLYTLSGEMSYHKISRILAATRYRFTVARSFWNLAGATATILPRQLLNFKTIQQYQQPMSIFHEIWYVLPLSE